MARLDYVYNIIYMLLKQKDYKMVLKSYRIKTYVHSYNYVIAFLNKYLAACLQVDKIIVLYAFLADFAVAIGSPYYSPCYGKVDVIVFLLPH